MSLTQLATTIQNYTTAIKKYVDDRIHTALVSETVSILAGATNTYDLTALLGTNHAQYDKVSSNIIVRVLDTDTASPTYNLYINSEAVVTVGVDTAGQVVVNNHSNADITCYIRIDVPRTL